MESPPVCFTVYHRKEHRSFSAKAESKLIVSSPRLHRMQNWCNRRRLLYLSRLYGPGLKSIDITQWKILKDTLVAMQSDPLGLWSEFWW